MTNPSVPHWREAKPVEQEHVAVAPWIGRSEEFGAVEDRVGAGEEAHRLRLVAHILSSGREPHHDRALPTCPK